MAAAFPSASSQCLCLTQQGKTVIQAEIDAAAELIDFFRFNAKYALELEKSQPISVDISTNSMVYRGLEVRGWPLLLQLPVCTQAVVSPQ